VHDPRSLSGVRCRKLGAVTLTARMSGSSTTAEIGTAVVNAGKHLWIEKPVGLSVSDALAVARATEARGVATAVGFNYRNAPAVAAARELIAAGELGEITHARFYFLSGYAAQVLGDLASHGVDLVRYLLGEVESVFADTAIFIAQRPVPTEATSGHQLGSGGHRDEVENEDYVVAQMRLASGARCALEASRVSVGEQNAYGFEIHGTSGVVAWDFRRIGELRVGTGAAFQDQAVTTRYVGPGDGEYAAFQPVCDGDGIRRTKGHRGAAVPTIHRVGFACGRDDLGCGGDGTGDRGDR